MHIQKNRKIVRYPRGERTKIMSISKLIAHKGFNSPFPMVYTIQKNLHRQAYDKIEFGDADTCADNASLVIKC